jgi:hypothetical protein
MESAPIIREQDAHHSLAHTATFPIAMLLQAADMTREVSYE